MNNELKACPFCGGEAELIQCIHNKRLWYVECPDKDCPSWEVGGKKKAIKAWNTRQPDKEPK